MGALRIVSYTETEIEQEIQDKGLDAPRLTPDDIDNVIKETHFFVFPGTTTTVCCLVLQNGYTVVGKSACVHPDNFNQALGEKIAKEDARQQIWALEGYLLRQCLYEVELDAAGAPANAD